jgi:hypothetical protein
VILSHTNSGLICIMFLRFDIFQGLFSASLLSNILVQDWTRCFHRDYAIFSELLGCYKVAQASIKITDPNFARI